MLYDAPDDTMNILRKHEHDARIDSCRGGHLKIRWLRATGLAFMFASCTVEEQSAQKVSRKVIAKLVGNQTQRAHPINNFVWILFRSFPPKCCPHGLWNAPSAQSQLQFAGLCSQVPANLVFANVCGHLSANVATTNNHCAS